MVDYEESDDPWEALLSLGPRGIEAAYGEDEHDYTTDMLMADYQTALQMLEKVRNEPLKAEIEQLLQELENAKE